MKMSVIAAGGLKGYCSLKIVGGAAVILSVMLQMTLHLKLTLSITVRTRILTNQLITRGNNCGKSSNRNVFFLAKLHHKISE